MTIRQALSQAVQTLEAAGVPDPRIDAELMLCHTMGMQRMQLLLSSNQELTHEQEQRFSSLLLSRTKRQPVQYLLGEAYFYGLCFRVDNRVLIPRQETEELCQLGIGHLKALARSGLRALDLCTGSGAIAVTLKHGCPQTDVFASEKR